jgi:hypothetical protein
MRGVSKRHRRATQEIAFATGPCLSGLEAHFSGLERRTAMALYEMRTYTLYVGKMTEAAKLYQEFGFPALQKGGHDKKLIGYFQGDTGTINQLVHLWKFDDDADRRQHWAGVFANKDFMEGFASRLRPLVMSQEVKLLTAAPWGPHP